MYAALPAFDNALRRLGRAVAGAVLVATAAACGDDPTASEPRPQPDPSAVARVEITGIVEISQGRSRPLTATVRAADGRVLLDRQVTWASSDTTVAIVADGVVFGQRVGTAIISAAVAGKRDSTPVYIQPLGVALVRLDTNFAALAVGETRNFSATTHSIDGELIFDRAITWHTSDPSIATVDATGKLTALRQGLVEVVAVSELASGKALVRIDAARVAATWQLAIGDIMGQGVRCAVSGIELVIEQQGDSLWGEAVPGPHGTSASCTRIEGQVPKAMTTPFPPIGPFTGRVVDKQVVLKFEFFPWELRATLTAQSMYGPATWSGDPIDGVSPVAVGQLYANRKR